MTKTFKSILATILVVSIFTACSSNDDNPENKTVKLIPTKITLMDEEGDLYAESTLTYNNKNQLIKQTYEDGDYFEVKYDETGRLIQFGEDSYIYKDKIVEFRRSEENHYDNTDYTLDNNGILVSSKIVRYPELYFYSFDKDGNLLKMLNEESEILLSATYSDFFSPFRNMNLPSYFMLFDDIWGIQATGLHMPLTFEDDSYKVTESKDNYPTKIEEIGEDGKTKFVYTITYSEMK